jgi:hypothetical protein
VGGCAGSDPATPVDEITTRGRSIPVRIESMDIALREAGGDPAGRAGVVRALEQVAWDPTEVAPVRAAAVRSLINSGDPEVVARARAKAAEVLPRETSREVVLNLCEAAGQQRWTELTAPLVRSYSRFIPMVPAEADRSERAALLALHPGKSIEQIAFDTFLAATGPGSDRVRSDAWDLLARLDRDGSARRSMLAATPADDPDIRAILAAQRDLRAIPLTGHQIAWVRSLADPAKADNAQWWSQASSAIAGLPESQLALRHAEPLRFATESSSPYLRMSRADLLAEITRRLEPRDHVERTGDPQNVRPREAISQVSARLAWADLVAILILDDAVFAPGVADTLWQQAVLDRKDTTTEYGGLVRLSTAGPGFTMFPPRPGERQGDNRFIASPDLIARSDTAVAHYHFHAQTRRNHDVAGPSPGDFEYADRFGRSCLVFTTLDNGRLGVDYYQPGGVALDLGTIRASEAFR